MPADFKNHSQFLVHLRSEAGIISSRPKLKIRWTKNLLLRTTWGTQKYVKSSCQSKQIFGFTFFWPAGRKLTALFIKEARGWIERKYPGLPNIFPPGYRSSNLNLSRIGKTPPTYHRVIWKRSLNQGFAKISNFVALMNYLNHRMNVHICCTK